MYAYPQHLRSPKRRRIFARTRAGLAVSAMLCALAFLACQASPSSANAPSLQKGSQASAVQTSAVQTSGDQGDEGTTHALLSSVTSGGGVFSKAAASRSAPRPGGMAAYAVYSGGELTPLPGAPYPTGSQPEGLTISPNGKYLYITNANSGNERGGIAAYAIGPDGKPAPLPESPYACGSDPGNLAVSPSGKYLYVANGGSITGRGGVFAYAVGRSGTLTPLPGSPYSTGRAATPWGIAMTPDGKYLYLTNSGSTDGSEGLFAYAVAADGTLSTLPGSPYPTGPMGTPWGLAISPDGRALYLANGGDSDGKDGLSAYAIASNGTLSEMPGSPYATGSAGSPWAVAITPNGKYLYVTNDGSDTGSRGLSAYAIGPAGALTALPIAAPATGSEPEDLAISPDGKYLYVTNWGTDYGSGGLSAYAIGKGGALTPLSEAPFYTGMAGSPWSVAISPNGSFLYVTNQGSDDGGGGLSAYRIASDNALSAPAAGAMPVGVALSPHGEFFYVTKRNSVGGVGGLSAYAVSPGGGLAALPGSPYPTGPAGNPAGVAISPSGKELYVVNHGSTHGEGGLSGYLVASDGSLSALSGSPSATSPAGHPYAVAIDPSGKELYVTNQGSPDGQGGLSGFAVGPTGGLIPLLGSPYPTGAAGYPTGLAISPNGRFLYVTNYGSADGEGGLSAFRIGSGGTLTPLPGSPYTTSAGGYPKGVAVSADGKHLFVISRGNRGAAAISVYSVESNGALSPITDRK